MYNMDKLYEAVAAKGPVCLGLDTAAEYVPEKERRRANSDAGAILAFNKALVDSTADIAACYKVQIAYYEELGLPGLKAYSETLKYIRAKGALVISDIKRGDIADTAGRYARAHFEGDFETDFVTLNPYLGMDSLEPWLQWADNKGKGAFILMLTSNKGRRDFEELMVEGGSPPLAPGSAQAAPSAAPPPGGFAPKPRSANQRLYHTVGDKLSALFQTRMGTSGYAAFGAVVGADPKSSEEREEARALRESYSKLFFLIPGYGAQGGAAEDAALLLREANGGVVNASRSILKAWQKKEPQLEADNAFAAEAAREAAMEMQEALRNACRASHVDRSKI